TLLLQSVTLLCRRRGWTGAEVRLTLSPSSLLIVVACLFSCSPDLFRGQGPVLSESGGPRLFTESPRRVSVPVLPSDLGFCALSTGSSAPRELAGTIAPAMAVVGVSTGVMKPLLSKLTKLLEEEYVKLKGVRKQIK
ncbi:unnamed protein product, partial [Urochloa humidicola]